MAVVVVVFNSKHFSTVIDDTLWKFERHPNLKQIGLTRSDAEFVRPNEQQLGLLLFLAPPELQVGFGKDA